MTLERLEEATSATSTVATTQTDVAEATGPLTTVATTASMSNTPRLHESGEDITIIHTSLRMNTGAVGGGVQAKGSPSPAPKRKKVSRPPYMCFSSTFYTTQYAPLQIRMKSRLTKLHSIAMEVLI